jgi:mRNA-degrading endonuclease RelE of RelBE toxin-antitoxin system
MYNVNIIPFFNRATKKLQKKYSQIKKDLLPLIDKLEQGIFEGDRLQGFAGEIYKVRVASSDQKKGKSGGFRILYYVVTKDKNIWLMYIYAKASQSNLTSEQTKELKNIVKRLDS